MAVAVPKIIATARCLDGDATVGGSDDDDASIDDVWREHFRQLVVLQAAAKELLFCQVAVAVLVHPREDVLGALLGRVGRLGRAGAQHVVDGLNDLGHLLLVDDTVAVDVVHPAKKNRVRN